MYVSVSPATRVSSVTSKWMSVQVILANTEELAVTVLASSTAAVLQEPAVINIIPRSQSYSISLL